MAKKWENLTAAEKGKVARTYANEVVGADSQIAQSMNGLTDEEIGNDPNKWPYISEDGKAAFGTDYSLTNTGQYGNDGGGTNLGNMDTGEYMLATLRQQGHPLPQMIEDGTSADYEVGNPGKYEQADYDAAADEYDPNRGLSQRDFETYAGVRPGTRLNEGAYDRDGAGTAALLTAGKQRNEVAGRPDDRYNIDPNAVPVIDPMTISNPAAIEAQRIRAEQTNTADAFEQTYDQTQRTGEVFDNILSRGAAGMQSASAMARDAAQGKTMSQAEILHLAAGSQAKTAYERIAEQAAIDSRNKANALRMQQQAMAAGQRGAVSGSANLQAMNNAALGEAQLYQQALDTKRLMNVEATGAMTNAQQQAAAVRAQEMADARSLYAQIETQLRAGNIQAAQGLADLAGVTLSADGQILSAQAQNTQMENAARTTNAANDLAAQSTNAANQLTVGQTNASNDLAAQTTNAATTTSVLQSNQGAQQNAVAQDDAAGLAYDQLLLGETEADRQARILREQNKQEIADRQATLLGNIYTGNATNQTALTAAENERKSRESGAIVGAIGTIAGAAIASDERMKTVKGGAPTPDFRATAGGVNVSPRAIPQDSGQLAGELARRTGSNTPPVGPTDFTRARDERYVYKGDPTKTNYTGPMAQQLPTNVQLPGPNGRRYVDTGRLTMNLASAVGDLQRRVGLNDRNRGR